MKRKSYYKIKNVKKKQANLGNHQANISVVKNQNKEVIYVRYDCCAIRDALYQLVIVHKHLILGYMISASQSLDRDVTK